MLQEIQQKAMKINNKSDTLRWGSCLEQETLVLVAAQAVDFILKYLKEVFK